MLLHAHYAKNYAGIIDTSLACTLSFIYYDSYLRKTTYMHMYIKLCRYIASVFVFTTTLDLVTLST